MTISPDLIKRGWKEYKLGDVIDIKHGYAFKGEYFSDEQTENILVTPGNFRIGGGFKTDKLKFYNGEVPADYILHTNDVIVTMTDLSKEQDTLGYSAVVPKITGKKFLHNQRIGHITCRSNYVNIMFINWLLRTEEYRWQIIGSASGSTVSHTSPSRILEYQFFLPPLPEQRAIAGVLSSLDDKIDLLHRQNKTLETMAEALWRKMFVEYADPNWKKGKLGDFITVKGGTTPSTTNQEFWNGDIYWTSPRDLSGSDKVFLHETERRITEKGLNQIGSGLLPIGTVLLSSRAPIGYLIISNIPVAINQGYIAVICNRLFSNYYMFNWIKSNMDLIVGSANGSTFLEISKSVFKDLETEIPNESNIEKFNSAVKPIFSKILSNEIQIRTISNLRENLIPKLMGGEVRIKL